MTAAVEKVNPSKMVLWLLMLQILELVTVATTINKFLMIMMMTMMMMMMMMMAMMMMMMMMMLMMMMMMMIIAEWDDWMMCWSHGNTTLAQTPQQLPAKVWNAPYRHSCLEDLINVLREASQQVPEDLGCTGFVSLRLRRCSFYPQARKCWVAVWIVTS